MSLIKSVAFLTSPSQCLMRVLSIFFYQDELKRLKNIEQNTNHLKELGLWEYAPKKPKRKGSQQGNTLFLWTESSSRVQKVTMVWTFSYFFIDMNFNFQIYFDCELRQRLTMKNYCLSKSAMPGMLIKILQSKM